MAPSVRVVPAGAFGDACLAALVEAVGGRPSPAVGLPTGNTPVPLYTALDSAVRAGRLGVADWRPIAIDEYGGPPGHVCSNGAFFRRHWDTIPGAPMVAQFDPSAEDRHAEAARLAAVVADGGGLDVALLGIGLNGHLAFNEPGSLRESTARVVELHAASRQSARACWGDATPTWGLTLGLRELLGAQRVVVMANGPAKAEIVRRAIEGPQSEDCPASLAKPGAATAWMLDEDAAALLSR